MRIKFHQSLDDLKERLLVMAGLAEQLDLRLVGGLREQAMTAGDVECVNTASSKEDERKKNAEKQKHTAAPFF